MRSKDTSISRLSKTLTYKVISYHLISRLSKTLAYEVISYKIRFFPAYNIMLSGVRQANADGTRSVVWNCVETYTVDMTPHAYTKDHS